MKSERRFQVGQNHLATCLENRTSCGEPRTGAGSGTIGRSDCRSELGVDDRVTTTRTPRGERREAGAAQIPVAGEEIDVASGGVFLSPTGTTSALVS